MKRKSKFIDNVIKGYSTIYSGFIQRILLRLQSACCVGCPPERRKGRKRWKDKRALYEERGMD
jgi:hypothetical protein